MNLLNLLLFVVIAVYFMPTIWFFEYETTRPLQEIQTIGAEYLSMQSKTAVYVSSVTMEYNDILKCEFSE